MKCSETSVLLIKYLQNGLQIYVGKFENANSGVISRFRQ